MKNCIQNWIALMAIAIGLLPSICAAGGLYGNDTAATARPILADGMSNLEQLTPAAPNAWFVFRIDANQSYAIDVWNPYGRYFAPGNNCVVANVTEVDGTTNIATSNRKYDLPAPQVEHEPAFFPPQGGRNTFIASGASRAVKVLVTESNVLAQNHYCLVRVVTTTLASARWSVNGYSDFIAVSNVSSASTGGTISGKILYFSDAGALVGFDAFSLGPDASVQFAKPNGVAIGGALKGGIRIVHDGAPGAIIAHQLWFNPVTNAYIQYPFVPLVHSYGRGGI